MTMTSLRCGWVVSAAMALRASQATPPVSAPSPMTATTQRSCSPRTRWAFAIPSAHDSEVEAWEFSSTSCALSARDG